MSKSSTSHRPTIIFDFDGTIADSFTPTIKILAEDYKRWGDRFHRQHTVNQLRSLTILEIIHTIPGGWWKFVYLLVKAKKYLRAHVREIKPYPGIIYTLHNLHDQGFPLLIVTSNSRAQVADFLHHFHLDNIFLEIRPTHGIWRKAKTLKQVVKDHHLHHDNCFYIGDEIRDIQACKKIGLPIISVSYGYNSAAGLERFQPNFLVKKPTQILTTLQQYLKTPSQK